MIRIVVLGDIGSGKSHVAKSFGYPVFNAENEVKKIYSKDKGCYKKLKKAIPQYISSFFDIIASSLIPFSNASENIDSRLSSKFTFSHDEDIWISAYQVYLFFIGNLILL